MRTRRIAVLCAVMVVGLTVTPSAFAAATWSNTITGAGSSALSSPEGVAMDGANVVVADAGNHRLEVFAPDGTVESFSTSVSMTEPRQAVLIGNDFVVSDHGASTVEKINATTGADDGPFGPPPGGWSANDDITVNGDGSLVAVANVARQAVDVFTSGGTFLRSLSATGGSAAALKYPEGVAFDASNNVWVGDTQNHRIVEFSASDGSFVTAWSYTESGSNPFYPTAISIDQRTGNLWVADWRNRQVLEFAPDGTALATVTDAGNGQTLSAPLTLALDPVSGDLYVADEYGNRVVRYTGAGSSGAPSGEAPSVTTVAADGISRSGATLHGTVNPNGSPLTECKFVWGTDVNYRSAPVPCTPTVGAGTSPVSVSAQISGLTAGQTYHFALVATNAAGLTGGSDAQFLAASPPSAATVNASSSDAHALVINGSVSDTGGADTHYYFQWGPDLDHMPNNTPAVDIGASPAGASAVLHNLQPFTQYCFRLIAYNAMGLTYAHDAGSGDPGTNRGKCASTTGGPIPTVTTSTPQGADVALDHISLSGSIETPAGASSKAYFQISTSPDLSGATTVPVTTPTTAVPLPWADNAPHIVGATATGLKQGVTYYWRLVGSSAGGQNYGNIVNAVTLSNTCHQQVKFGPLTAIAGPVTVSGGTVSIGRACMQQKGLTWVTNGTVTIAGLHITPDSSSTQVVIDPLNLMVRSTGTVKVTIGPWVAFGHQLGPVVLQHRDIVWAFQAPPAPVVAEAMFLAIQRIPGGLWPQLLGNKLPPTLVKLPDLSSKLPKLPNLGVPDFSKVANLTDLAHLAGINPGTITTDLNKPTVTFPAGLIPNVNLPTSCVATTDASLAGLPFDGGACLTITNNLTKIDAQASLPTLFTRPDLVFGQVGLDATVHMELDATGKVTTLVGHADVPRFSVGPLTMNDSTIDYNGANDEWTGNGGGGLFDDAIGVMAHFDVVRGGLTNGTLALTTPDVPVGPTGLFLDAVGVQYSAAPAASIGGTAVFGYGPLVPFAKGSGHVFKFSVNPWFDAGPRTLHLVGDLYALTDPVHGQYTQLSTPGGHTLHIDWNGSTGAISAGASIGFSKQQDLGWPLGKSGITASASLGGSFIPGSPPKFQLDGSGTLSLMSNILTTGISAKMTVSSAGFAACADGTFAGFQGEAGVGYKWGGAFQAWLNKGVCDLGPYRVMAAQAAHDAAHAAAPRGFLVRPGQRQVDLTFSGNDGAPEVILRSPTGAVVRTPATGSVAATRNTLAIIDRANHWTAIDLYRPAPGRWTIETAPGSPAVARSEQSVSLPSPDVRVRVVKRGRGYVLAYRMAAIPGQRVTFSEEGRSVAHVIGATGRASGTVPFTPADGSAGTRSIVADIDQDGLPRRREVVGHYRAPAPGRLAQPRALRIVRSGSRASITWRKVSGASSYLLAVTYNAGYRTVRAVHGTRLSLDRVFANRAVVASVAALDSHGHAGQAARTRSDGHLPVLRARPKRRHRSH